MADTIPNVATGLIYGTSKVANCDQNTTEFKKNHCSTHFEAMVLVVFCSVALTSLMTFEVLLLWTCQSSATNLLNVEVALLLSETEQYLTVQEFPDELLDTQNVLGYLSMGKIGLKMA